MSDIAYNVRLFVGALDARQRAMRAALDKGWAEPFVQYIGAVAASSHLQAEKRKRFETAWAARHACDHVWHNEDQQHGLQRMSKPPKHKWVCAICGETVFCRVGEKP